MILDLLEERPIALAGAGRNLSFFGAAHPADRVVVGPAAPGTLKPGGPLLRFLGEELSLIHSRRVHEMTWALIH
jgi:hypothetical protein